MKRIYFTVTNDLTYDQRMHRICGSLARAGYDVTLVGRSLPHSLPLLQKSFRQKRLACFFRKGFLFYAEYNIRLFFFLLRSRMDGICAIDLDTILPCLLISRLKKIPRIYDAHEYFTELKEVLTRPFVRKFWLAVERYALPRYDKGYTVGEGLAAEFKKRYGRNYEVIRNVPVLKEIIPNSKREKFIVYQGAVNEARGFEYLIPAMKNVEYKLVVCGDGNFMSQLRELIIENDVSARVELRGMLLPEQLWEVAQKASIGMGLAEKEGLNQFLALPNKFFDYIHAGLPQIVMDYPEYQKVNRQYKVAVLLDNLAPERISETINGLMRQEALLQELHENCLKARQQYCWQAEEKKLIAFYQEVFNVE